MGDLPLRTPTHRRLGGPLHPRLPNAPHAHPRPDLSFPPIGMPPWDLRGIRRRFHRLSPGPGQVAYVLLTRAPVAGKEKQAFPPAAPRLACVKPVASVHPEPGSNSSLYEISFLFRSFRICCLCWLRIYLSYFGLSIDGTQCPFVLFQNSFAALS